MAVCKPDGNLALGVTPEVPAAVVEPRALVSYGLERLGDVPLGVAKEVWHGTGTGFADHCRLPGDIPACGLQ